MKQELESEILSLRAVYKRTLAENEVLKAELRDYEQSMGRANRDAMRYRDALRKMPCICKMVDDECTRCDALGLLPSEDGAAMKEPTQ